MTGVLPPRATYRPLGVQIDRPVSVGGTVGGTVGECVAFYAVVVVRELRGESVTARRGPFHQVLVDLLVEFGPAEALDSLLVRPLGMYAGRWSPAACSAVWILLFAWLFTTSART